jgi:hypothetical protein
MISADLSDNSGSVDGFELIGQLFKLPETDPVGNNFVVEPAFLNSEESKEGANNGNSPNTEGIPPERADSSSPPQFPPDVQINPLESQTSASTLAATTQQNQPSISPIEAPTETSQRPGGNSNENPVYDADGFLEDKNKTSSSESIVDSSANNTWTIVACVTGALIFIGLVAALIYRERQSSKSEMDLETISHPSMYSDSNYSDSNYSDGHSDGDSDGDSDDANQYARPASSAVSSLATIPEITTANPF